MKIVEKKSDIEVKGAKFATADRPDNLSPFLNYYNLSLIIGLPASGKSSLIKTLLNGSKTDNLYNNVFHSVYYITASNTMDLKIPDEKYIVLDGSQPLDSILQNIIDNESNIGEEDEPHHVAVFMDDAINFINTNRQALNIFRKLVMNGRHILGKHSSLITFIVSQKVKSIPLTIRSQANQIFFFDSTKAEKGVVQDEFLPLDKKEADQLYNYIYDRPHNFMFVNLFIPKDRRIFKNFNQLILKDYN
tara:strand:+ start:413 stop:1153 length:741 start_codon:yes stop_codon:yes gene_type:complete